MKTEHVTLIVEPTTSNAKDETTLVESLKEFVAFAVASYRDGMAEDTETPEQFIGLCFAVWKEMKEGEE